MINDGILTTVERLIVNLVKSECLKVHIKEDKLIWEEVELSSDLTHSQAIPAYDLITHIAQKEAAYLRFNNGRIYSHTRPVITLILADIELLEMGPGGTPIVLIDGDEVRGYAKISEILFGYHKKDIAQILKPYIEVPDVPENELVIENFRLIRVSRNYYKKPIPIIGYQGMTFKGVKPLATKYPGLDIPAVLEHIGYQSSAPRVKEPKKDKPIRAQQLIDTWRIDYAGFSFFTVHPTNPEEGNKDFPSQAKLIAYLKSQGEHIGRDTSRKMFKLLKE